MRASEPSNQNMKIQIRSREGDVRVLILAVQYSINGSDFMKGDPILHVRYQIYGHNASRRGIQLDLILAIGG